MKGSVLTGKTWWLLVAAALLIAAGALNFSQRLRLRPPAWDGVTWDGNGSDDTSALIVGCANAATAWRRRMGSRSLRMEFNTIFRG